MTLRSDDDTASALLAVAEAHGLQDADRAALWRERLDEDRPIVRMVHDARLERDVAPVDLRHLVAERPARPHHAAKRARADFRPDGSVSEKVEAALERIAASSELNAFTRVLTDEARKAAADLDRRIGRGEAVGPLAGRLVAVKDLIDVAGQPTTGGTRALHRPEPNQDAACVSRLREAGAVVIGLANLHALAYGALSTSSDHGAVANPHRPYAVAGGSSGGSAAAVAAGLVDLALGTDTAGSIRIPAAHCGVVGLKPTFGRVPTSGVQALGPSLDHVGPITSTVTDAAMALAVLSDQPFDAPAIRRTSLEGITVGIPGDYFFDHLDGEVRAAIDTAVDAVRELGGEVQEVRLPTVALAPGVQLCTLSPEAFEVHERLLRERGDQLPDDVRLRLEVGMFRSAPEYLRAQRLRSVMQREMYDALTDADVLLAPTLPVPAVPIGARHLEVEGARWTAQFAVTRLTMPFNLTGFPALSLPWDEDSGGGRIGVQLAGRPMDEVTLLGVAHALEHLRDHRG